ncbi:carboxypeptidase regulatory-like domain-containing protein, partial [Candidatus Hydrogenedentota bacterium]
VVAAIPVGSAYAKTAAAWTILPSISTWGLWKVLAVVLAGGITVEIKKSFGAIGALLVVLLLIATAIFSGRKAGEPGDPGVSGSETALSDARNTRQDDGKDDSEDTSAAREERDEDSSELSLTTALAAKLEEAGKAFRETNGNGEDADTEKDATVGGVAGFVVDRETRQLIAGATVYVVAKVPEHVSLLSPSSSHATTDDAGEFLMKGLLPGTMNIVATSSGYVSSSQENVTIDAGKTTLDIKIELGGGTSVSGHVYVNGRKTSGVTVSASTPQFFDLYDTGVAQTKTDGNGFYRLAGFIPGRYWVNATYVRGAGSKRQAGKLIALKEDEAVRQDIEFAGGTCSLDGYALRDGVPVPGSRVELWRERLSRFPVSTTTNEQGYFRFDNVPAGEAYIQAAAFFPDLEMERYAFEPVTLIEGAELGRDLIFSFTGGTVQGHVYKNGNPAQGILLHAYPTRKGGRGSKYVYATTDKDGFYKVQGLASERYWINCRFVLPNGGVTYRDKPVTVVENETIEHNVHFVDGSAVHGTVYVNDKPQEGALVHSQLRNRIGVDTPDDCVVASISNSDGRYHMASLVPGVYEIGAYLDLGSTERYSSQIVEVGEEPVTLDLRMGVSDTGDVYGYTVDESGTPLAGAIVQIESREGQDRFRQRKATDSEGDYSFKNVSAGRVVMSVSIPVENYPENSWGWNYRELQLFPGESLRQDFVLQTVGGTVFGTVTWNGEYARRNYRVLLYSDEENSPIYAALDENRFRFDNLTGGRYLIQCFPGGNRILSRYVDVEEGREIQVDFDSVSGTSRIVGRIIPPADYSYSAYEDILVALYEPGTCLIVEGAEIPRTMGAGIVAKVRLTNTDTFSFDDLPAGKFDLVGILGEDNTCLALKKQEIVLSENETTEVVINLAE